jgi:hypothetical protein
LEDNLYAPPKSKVSDFAPLSTDAEASAPPRLVIIAIAIIFLSSVAGLARRFLVMDRADPIGFGVGLVLGGALVYVWLHALYQGRNWVRWLGLANAAMGVGLMYSRYGVARVSVAWTHELYMVQGTAQAAATVLLFLPASNRWFTRDRKV